MFQWILSSVFATCSKPPSRVDHHKVSYPRTKHYPAYYTLISPPGLRTRSIFIQVQVRVQPILASRFQVRVLKFNFFEFKFEFGKITKFFLVQVWVRSPDTCAVFLGRHDINKTVKDIHLCSCYEKRYLNLHGLISNTFFPDKFLILKFLFKWTRAILFEFKFEFRKIIFSSSSSAK